VGLAGLVKVAEMLPIMGQHGSSVCVRERQHFLVWDPSPAKSTSATVSTSWPSCRSPRTVGFGKVLISEEAGRLGRLILSDLPVDLVEVTSDK
jgi:hypothetical protein